MTHAVPGMSRRRFALNAATTLGGVSAAGLTAACSGTVGKAASRDNPAVAGRELADTVLEAFTTHRLVGLGEVHGLQNHHDALTLLLTDPRLPGVVDDIVVEFGNALYQDTIDRFIAGQPVDNARLRQVWRTTTQSPLATWDEPVYEQFYRTVRTVNATLPAGKQIRVLLGDPPLDWSTITSADQLRTISPQRDRHAASVIEKHVLGKGRRALICYGLDHLTHGGSLAGGIERQTGERPYLIADFLPLARDPGGYAKRLSRYPRDTIIPAAGTWLGSADAGLLVPPDLPSPGAGQSPHGQPSNRRCGKRAGSVIDAVLYLGQTEDLTSTWWNPAIFLDPGYWRELQRRNALQGNRVNLDSYRQEHPAAFPPQKVPPSQQCGKAAQAS
jgi:hypothetical protein